MDGSAIQTIAGLSAAHAASVILSDNDLGAVVIPEGYKLDSLERLKPLPDLFRGKFSTTVLSQFIDYVDDNASNSTVSVVFINQDSMTAEAIIDMGTGETPQWGKHRASAVLKMTPAYAALLKFGNMRLDQQDLIDFAEDWQDNIQFYSNSQDMQVPIRFKDAIKALRKLKTSATATSKNEVGNFSANRSAMEAIEVTAGSEQPPAGFIFKVIPHDGFDEMAFDCQLRAMPDAKVVFLKYRIGQLAQLQEEIAEQFRYKIQAGISVVSISIYIGHMEYQQ